MTFLFNIRDAISRNPRPVLRTFFYALYIVFLIPIYLLMRFLRLPWYAFVAWAAFVLVLVWVLSH